MKIDVIEEVHISNFFTQKIIYRIVLSDLYEFIMNNTRDFEGIAESQEVLCNLTNVEVTTKYKNKLANILRTNKIIPYNKGRNDLKDFTIYLSQSDYKELTANDSIAVRKFKRKTYSSILEF